MSRHHSLRLALATLPALLLVATGCGDSGTYRVSGKVTHKGEPVPKGYIIFIPDTSKGNSGPGGAAEIINGEYRTPDGKGVVGGAYIVQIVGFDGVPYTASGEEILEGKSLFNNKYEITVDFPTESTVKDFTVPDKVPPPKKKVAPGDDRDGY